MNITVAQMIILVLVSLNLGITIGTSLNKRNKKDENNDINKEA